MSTLALPLARGPLGQTLASQEAAKLTALVGDRPLYWLADLGAQRSEPNPSLLLHMQRRIPTITMREIDEALAEHPRLFILAPAAGPGAMPIPAADLEARLID